MKWFLVFNIVGFAFSIGLALFKRVVSSSRFEWLTGAVVLSVLTTVILQFRKKSTD